jgi:hypothetical protein
MMMMTMMMVVMMMMTIIMKKQREVKKVVAHGDRVQSRMVESAHLESVALREPFEGEGHRARALPEKQHMRSDDPDTPVTEGQSGAMLVWPSPNVDGYS